LSIPARKGFSLGKNPNKKPTELKHLKRNQRLLYFQRLREYHRQTQHNCLTQSHKAIQNIFLAIQMLYKSFTTLLRVITFRSFSIFSPNIKALSWGRFYIIKSLYNYVAKLRSIHSSHPDSQLLLATHEQKEIQPAQYAVTMNIVRQNQKNSKICKAKKPDNTSPKTCKKGKSKSQYS